MEKIELVRLLEKVRQGQMDEIICIPLRTFKTSDEYATKYQKNDQIYYWAFK